MNNNFVRRGNFGGNTRSFTPRRDGQSFSSRPPQARFQVFDPLEKEFPRNGSIRAQEVRVIGQNKENIGVLPLREALDRAEEEGLDLIMITSKANPPVCRIMAWDSFKYQHQKKEKEIKKANKSAKLKEIKLSPKIAGTDLQRKIEKITEITRKGDQVKITVMRKWPITIEGTRAFKDDLLTKIQEYCNIINVQEKGRNIYILVKSNNSKDAKIENK